MRRSIIIVFAAIYIFLSLVGLNLVYLFKEHTSSIIILYFIFIIIVTSVAVVLHLFAKREREMLRKNKISNLLQNINAMVIMWYPDFSYISVNERFTNITGYSQDDCKNINLLKTFMHPFSFDKSKIKELLNLHDVEMPLSCKDGKILTTVWDTTIIRQDGNKMLLMSMGMDFTQNVEMKKELSDFSNDLIMSKKRFQTSMQLSEIGILIRTIGSSKLFLSNQLQDMLGIESEEMETSQFIELVHPNDRVIFGAFCDINVEKADHSKTHNIEIRLLSYDGTYHWYCFRYKISRNQAKENIDIGGAIFDITLDKEKDMLIEKMAYIDEVTQIYNRNKFMLIGQETFDCIKDSNISYWIIVFDIDNFHIINDTCGYNNGNRLLKSIAMTLLKNLGEGGFGARIGGDNFAMLIKDDGTYLLPVKTISKIQKDLALLAVDVFSNQSITCSAGYCKMPDDGNDFANSLDHAEFALSLNDDTKGKISKYDNNRHDSVIAGNNIEKDLALAIDNGELCLYYQPKINLSTGEITGMEALVRWIKPNGVVMPPSFFIPIAENSMLITRVSDFVLNEACRQNKFWQDEGLPKFRVSINLTSTDFYQTDVKESISQALAKTGLEPQYLEIELTESLALKDVDQAIHQMNGINELGVKLAMDDFGTGYSSLSYIRVLPITLLKLDCSFIRFLEEDDVSKEIVSAVIRIAKSKNIETIAEGIETQGQANILRTTGCDHAQGFFFGKPMPAEQFKAFVLRKEKLKKVAV